MRKIINFILKNMIGFTLGVSLSIVLAVYAATTISSSQVTYTGNSQSTVNGALDDLYTKANTWINPNDVYLDYSSAKSNTTGRIFASNKGVCINRKKSLFCFKINNWAEEQNHIQQVFSDVSCLVSSAYVTCSASDFGCDVGSDGFVYCCDRSDRSSCGVYSDGSVDCN